MGRREQFTVGELTLTGNTQYVGAESITILQKDSAGMILLATGLTVPTDATAGYAKGCLFIDTNVVTGSTGLYENVGVTTSCNFDAIGVPTVGELSLAVGSMLVGAGAGVATAIDAKTNTAILIGNGTTVTAQTLDTDVTMSNTGAVTIAADAITTGKILNGAVTAPKLAAGVFTNTFGTRFVNPALAVTDRYFASANMSAAAYAVANPSSGDSLCRNVVATITQVGGANDTVGNLVIDGTNYSDVVIQETLALVQNGTATGVKAFKTVTGLRSATWVRDAGAGSEDTIVIGFGNKLGLSFIKNDAAAFLAAGLGTGLLMAPTVAVGAAIENMTVDLSGGTYDGAKDGFCLFNA